MNHNQPPLDPEPDWHGEKSKRKRERTIRVVGIRSFVFGLVVALGLIAIAGIVLMRNQDLSITPTKQLPGPTPTTAPTGPPDLFALTATALIARSQVTLDVPVSTLTAVPTIPRVTTIGTEDAIFEYQFSWPLQPDVPEDQLRLKEMSSLPLKPVTNYHFSGLQFGPQGYLYVAHSKALGMTDCDSNEAYWIVDPQSGQLISQLSYSSMVSARRIVFDSHQNAYVLAADCQRRVYAVFTFDSDGHWSDTFPIVGGDDLVISGSDRIFVAVRDPANGQQSQTHMIELHRDLATAKLKEVAELASNALTGGHFRSIISNHGSNNNFVSVLGIWVADNGPNTIKTFFIDPNADVASSNITVSDNGAVQSASGDISGTNLVSEQFVIFGLSLDGHFGFKLNGVMGGHTSQFPIPDITATSFAIDPTTENWFFVGHN